MVLGARHDAIKQGITVTARWWPSKSFHAFLLPRCSSFRVPVSFLHVASIAMIMVIILPQSLPPRPCSQPKCDRLFRRDGRTSRLDLGLSVQLAASSALHRKNMCRKWWSSWRGNCTCTSNCAMPLSLDSNGCACLSGCTYAMECCVQCTWRNEQLFDRVSLLHHCGGSVCPMQLGARIGLLVQQRSRIGRLGMRICWAEPQ